MDKLLDDSERVACVFDQFIPFTQNNPMCNHKGWILKTINQSLAMLLIDRTDKKQRKTYPKSVVCPQGADDMFVHVGTTTGTTSMVKNLETLLEADKVIIAPLDHLLSHIDKKAEVEAEILVLTMVNLLYSKDRHADMCVLID